MVELLKTILTPRVKTLLVVFLLTGVVLLSRQLTLPEPSVSLADLKPFSLAGFHRLLVLAPHCDDETLGSAGLI